MFLFFVILWFLVQNDGPWVVDPQRSVHSFHFWLMQGHRRTQSLIHRTQLFEQAEEKEKEAKRLSRQDRVEF